MPVAAIVHAADDVVVGGVLDEPADDGRRHQPLAERRSLSARSDPPDGDAVSVRFVRQALSDALGEHVHVHAVRDEIVRQALGVAFHAADDSDRSTASG